MLPTKLDDTKADSPMVLSMAYTVRLCAALQIMAPFYIHAHSYRACNLIDIIPASKHESIQDAWRKVLTSIKKISAC